MRPTPPATAANCRAPAGAECHSLGNRSLNSTSDATDGSFATLLRFNNAPPVPRPLHPAPRPPVADCSVCRSPADAECHQLDSCAPNSTTGGTDCSYSALQDGTLCSAGTCQSGLCVNQDTECLTNNCAGGDTSPGCSIYTPVYDGKTCSQGSCQGGICHVMDSECLIGGICVYHETSNTTDCTPVVDGTQCSRGACQGGTCIRQDTECLDSTCDPSGCLYYAKADGSSCTQGTCQSGLCSVFDEGCVEASSFTPLVDGIACTSSTSGGSGVCEGGYCLTVDATCQVASCAITTVNIGGNATNVTLCNYTAVDDGTECDSGWCKSGACKGEDVGVRGGAGAGGEMRVVVVVGS